ncbi:hypothetical protein FXO37_13876 [Capsicum annuum]|nr:hypothetical protein FXO37_13876 [Capsicum annuum]
MHNTYNSFGTSKRQPMFAPIGQGFDQWGNKQFLDQSIGIDSSTLGNMDYPYNDQEESIINNAACSAARIGVDLGQERKGVKVVKHQATPLFTDGLAKGAVHQKCAEELTGCANLDPKFNHIDHDHPLSLEFSLPQESNLTCDNVCSKKLLPDYWLYQCVPCRFFVHVKCARKKKTACDKTLPGSSYGCEACGFYLGNDCALSPLTITVQWDEHPLTLIFPPFTDHPDEFLYEICETYEHSKNWLYHCRDCDQYFHPHCIPQHGLSRNIKFGSTIQIAEHSLELVEKGEFKSQCGVCQDHLDKKNALLCTMCNLRICCKCACDILENKAKKNTEVISLALGFVFSSVKCITIIINHPVTVGLNYSTNFYSYVHICILQIEDQAGVGSISLTRNDHPDSS